GNSRQRQLYTSTVSKYSTAGSTDVVPVSVVTKSGNRNDSSVAAIPSTATSTIDRAGTAATGETLRKNPEKKNALSRDIAYTSREPEAIATSPHAKMLIITNPRNAVASLPPKRARKISGIGLDEATIASTLGMHSVIITRNSNPKMPLRTIES